MNKLSAQHFALNGPVRPEQELVQERERYKTRWKLARQLQPAVTVGTTTNMVLLVGVLMASMTSDARHFNILLGVLGVAGIGLFFIGAWLRGIERRAAEASELLDSIADSHERELLDLCDADPRVAALRERIASVRPLRRGDFRALHQEFARLQIARVDEEDPQPAPADQRPAINPSWVAHAYPLQQIVIQLQGTLHSNREFIIDQLVEVTERLRKGDVFGTHHDDDFGYRFEVIPASNGPSFFDEPAGCK